MINLETFFENHFHTEKISDNRLKAFTLDHMTKLASWLSIHTDPELSTLLTEVTTKYNAYFGAIDDEAIKLSIQKSRTVAVDNAWTAVLHFISQKEGIIRGIWGKDAPQYQEFYPQGIDEYSHATKLNKGTLLARYLAAATAHAAMLPAMFVTDFTTLKTDWETKFTAQQTQIGLVKDANSQTDVTRQPIEIQLELNLLIIASKNIGNPSMMADFFNQSLIRKHKEPIPAHTIIIRGRVTYGMGNPVAGAVVNVHGDNPGGEFTETDSDGKYEFVFNDVEQEEAGHITFTVTAQGFEEHKQQKYVEIGHAYTINVSLTQAMRIAA